MRVLQPGIVRAALCAAGLALACGGPALALDLDAQRQAQIAAAAQALASDPGRPAFEVTSSADEGRSYSRLVGAVPQLWERVDAALEAPSRWCEILLLTPGIAACSAGSDRTPAALEVMVLGRFDASSELGERHVIRVRTERRRPGYLRLHLDADTGPRGTRAHRVAVELADLSPMQSAVALSYAFEYDWETEIAQHAYDLAESPDKVGFSAEDDGGAAPRRVGGLRGASERQIVRLFLAIRAHAVQATHDPGRRFSQSLDQWLAATQAYPAQLAEPDPRTYRRIKLRQFGALE